MAKWLGAPVTGGATSATRARDIDRQETCKLLDNALGDGELSNEEHRERVSTATNAVTLGDLHQQQIPCPRRRAESRLIGGTHEEPGSAGGGPGSRQIR